MNDIDELCQKIADAICDESVDISGCDIRINEEETVANVFISDNGYLTVNTVEEPTWFYRLNELPDGIIYAVADIILG